MEQKKINIYINNFKNKVKINSNPIKQGDKESSISVNKRKKHLTFRSRLNNIFIDQAKRGSICSKRNFGSLEFKQIKPDYEKVHNIWLIL